MNSIMVKNTIDFDEKIAKWDEEIENRGHFSFNGWELKFYPIRNNIVIFTFECLIYTDDNDIPLYNYHFLLYDLNKNQLLDEEFSLEMQNIRCCTVLEVLNDELLLDMWDCANDRNFICTLNQMKTIIESGYGPSCSTAIKNTNIIAVGYGYEAVRKNNESPIKIYDTTNGNLLFSYHNPKALGCIDMYADEEGRLWAIFWGENRIVRFDTTSITEFECEMSGFSSIVMIGPNNELYVNFEYDGFGGDRIFKMILDNNRYVSPQEIKIKTCNADTEIEITKISSEHGYTLCTIKENVIGILEI